MARSIFGGDDNNDPARLMSRPFPCHQDNIKTTADSKIPGPLLLHILIRKEGDPGCHALFPSAVADMMVTPSG